MEACRTCIAYGSRTESFLSRSIFAVRSLRQQTAETPNGLYAT